MGFERRRRVIERAVNDGVFWDSIRAFDLAIDSRRIDLSQTMLNGLFSPTSQQCGQKPIDWFAGS